MSAFESVSNRRSPKRGSARFRDVLWKVLVDSAASMRLSSQVAQASWRVGVFGASCRSA
jgi:hypothetical protein